MEGTLLTWNDAFAWMVLVGEDIRLETRMEGVFSALLHSRSSLFAYQLNTVPISPAIVSFTPPTDCGDVGTWAGITLNLTVTSNGTQYDRLGILTFQARVWRVACGAFEQEGTIADAATL